MRRQLYQELKVWKDQATRLPLIVRGARQVGKSYLIEQFGRQEFSQLHVINFEKQPQFTSCFQELDPKIICRELELQAGISLKPGKSLLFLDEIQDCPQALKALRYFAEEMPELHVVAAGSLLEFVLEDKAFSFPVGRVQVMNLGPLTFAEYVLAKEEDALVDLLQNMHIGDVVSDGVHQKLLKLVREYMCVGGMPGVVSTFLKTGSYLEVKRRQSAILDLYVLDFGKYATRHAAHSHLKKLFERSPDLVGKHFRFSKIDPDCANPARDYREALNRLRQARLLLPVYFSQGNALPLRAEKNEKKLKIFLLDVGMLVFGLGWEDLGHSNASPLSRGIIAEQFVAEELTALQDPFIDRGLYYWENPKPRSTAEIDFLININQQIVPIEVKSGKTGTLKSLKQFIQTKGKPLGVRISERPLSIENGILSVPFYLIGQLARLLN